MENDRMIAVLTEVLEEQKETSRAQAEIILSIQKLKTKLDNIEELIAAQGNIIPSIDTKPIQLTVEKELGLLKTLMEMILRKSPSNNLRVFLESDAKKWAVYLVIALTFLTYLYLFTVHK